MKSTLRENLLHITMTSAGVDIEDLLPPKPRPPHPSDCCGTGCCPCVHDIYEQDMKSWKRKCEQIRNGCRESSEESSSAVVPYEWQEFEIVKIEELNASAYCYTFKIKDSQVLGIKIGQHIIVKQTVNGRVVTRQYTPVSEVSKRGSFEFVIKIYPNGKLTSLIKDWKVGDWIPCRGPFGEFSYQANSYKHILMLAAGTGIAPMFQIIREIIENEDDMTFIKLFYASKSISDILFREELVNFYQYWNFTACHYLSKEVDLTKKRHCEEMVGSRMSKENVLNELRKGPINSTLVLICGTKSFNKDMVNSAKDADIPDRNIFMF